MRVLEGHTRSVSHVAFSPDGKKLTSGSDDHTVRLWDVETSQAIGPALKGHTKWVNHVTFSPDGNKLASGSLDNTVRLWDIETCQAVGSALKGHTKWANHVTFSPDGRKLASESLDNTVRLWDVETCEAIGPVLQGHAGRATRVAFSPDGEKLVSGSNEKTVRDVETEQAVEPTVDSPPKHVADEQPDLLIPAHSQLGDTYWFDETGFLRSEESRLFWLPVTLRGSHISVRGSVIAVGSPLGAVTIIRL